MNSSLYSSQTLDGRTPKSYYSTRHNEVDKDCHELKVVEPLLQSVQRKSKNTKSKNKVHEYQIDPALEYGPGQVGSFRERRHSAYYIDDDTLRPRGRYSVEEDV